MSSEVRNIQYSVYEEKMKMSQKEDDPNGRWPQNHKIPLPDNLRSWCLVCNLILTQLTDSWRENEDGPKGRWPYWKMTVKTQNSNSRQPRKLIFGIVPFC
jgi:hypothetical protein